jgi:hypothetical protein
MAIKHDRSDSSGVVTTCTECPYWFSFQFEMPAAYRSAESHLIRVHDVDPHDAEAPRRLWDKRHAANT